MKNKNVILIIVLAFLISISGLTVYRLIPNFQPQAEIQNSEPEPTMEVVPTIDPSVKVDLILSKKAANTVILSISGLKSEMKSLRYELSYDSEGLIKGVNSGSKEIDVAGQDEFERDIYLGTCSRNVCKADTGVSTISVSLEFNSKTDQKSQFTGDFEI